MNNMEVLASVLEGGSFAIMAVLLYFLWQQFTTNSNKNLEFIQTLVQQASVDREAHLQQWMAMAQELLAAQREYTQMLEAYTEAFGLIEGLLSNKFDLMAEQHDALGEQHDALEDQHGALGEQHTVIIRELEKKDL